MCFLFFFFAEETLAKLQTDQGGDTSKSRRAPFAYEQVDLILYPLELVEESNYPHTPKNISI